MRHRIDRIRLACACVAALGIGAATPAGAELGAAHVVVSSGGSDSTSPKNWSVQCPAGTFALGGGESVYGSILGVSAVMSVPSLSIGTGDPVGWFGELTEMVSSASSWGVSAGAVCGTADGLEVVSATSPSDSNVKTVEVPCPPGKEALSGGFELLGSTAGVAVFDTTPTMDAAGVPNGWHVSAYEEVATAASWSIQVEAICANETILPFYAVVGPTSNQYEQGLLQCPANWIATGGGISLAGSVVDWVDTSTPSLPSGGWSGEVQRAAGEMTQVSNYFYVLCPEPDALVGGAIATAAIVIRSRRRTAEL
jgi:hypothetical protein